MRDAKTPPPADDQVGDDELAALAALVGRHAHDFNNVLGIIVSFTEFVRRNLDAGHASQDDLGEILAAVDRGEEVVRSLMSAARRYREPTTHPSPSPSPEPPPPPQPELPPSMATVLVVEPDPQVCRVFARGLARHDFKVLEAGDHPRALELCAIEPPALVVLELDGLTGPAASDLEARLRQLAPAARFVVIGSDRSIAARPRALGDATPLAKPFSHEELLARVRSALDGASAQDVE